MNFIGLIFICMLPVSASSQKITDFITEITGNFAHEQATQKLPKFTLPISDVNPKGEETMKTRPPPLLSAAQTAPYKTPLPDTSSNSISPHPNSPTIGMKTMTEVKDTTSAQTTAARVNPTLSSSTQSQETGKTTSLFTRNITTHLSTSATLSTNQYSTTASSTISISIKKESTTKISTTTAKTAVIQITKTKKKPDPPQKKSEKGTRDSKIVAGLISGALLLMMVGFLIIYLKKRKLREQQVTTSDWAGPSPFLEGGADNGGVALRSSNRISLSSFLPQRLSKRLSMLQETDEELQEITPGTTFGNTYQGGSFGREGEGYGVSEGNGTAAPEMKSAESPVQAVENSANQSNPPTLIKTVENATAQIDNEEN